MSHWNSTTQQIITFTDYPCEDYPGWWVIDCGCCAGLEWGGEEPRECDTCAGSGRYFEHRKSGRFAQYPGGPFVGRKTKREMSTM